MSEKVAGASYVLNFYRDVILLTHYVTVYLNLMTELEFKYSDLDLGKLDVEEKNGIVNSIQNVRYFANKCKIEYASLKKRIKFEEEDDKEILKIHKLLNAKEKFVILREDSERYAELMNSLLVNDVIQNILETNQELLQHLFGDSEKANQYYPPAGQESSSF